MYFNTPICIYAFWKQISANGFVAFSLGGFGKGIPFLKYLWYEFSDF